MYIFLFLQKKILFIRLELFQPFILRKLIKLKIINNIREGKSIILKKKIIVTEILKKIIENMRLINNKYNLR
jgi:hypothetical protein